VSVSVDPLSPRGFTLFLFADSRNTLGNGPSFAACHLNPDHTIAPAQL